MAQDIRDHAQLLAEGLGIDPSSYTGQEGLAISAMTLVSGYRRMERWDKDQVLYRIEEMHLGAPFQEQCRVSLGMMTVNPDWEPGSLSNAELTGEIDEWRGISKILAAMGFAGGLSTFASGKGKTIFKNITTGKPALKNVVSPGAVAGAAASVAGYAAQSIATQSIADLGAEATRRGQLGTMTPLNAGRFGASR